MNNFDEILRKLGLTNQESRVYVSLLEMEEAQTGALCKATKVARSNIYAILDSLISKGLVSYRIQNNIKVFLPSRPEALNNLFIEKQQELEQERKRVQELVKTLEKRRVTDEPYSKYRYFENINGIKSMWNEINATMNNSTILKLHACRKGSYENLVGFYTEHHKIRVGKKIQERMIFPVDEQTLAKKRTNKYTQIRFADLKKEVEWGIVNDMLYIQYITGKVPRGFLINDKKFAEAFEEVFDKLWEQAKT